MSVCVVGSFVTDLVARTERAPEAGETVTGLSFNTFPGGKGANQAIAARRLGAQVEMIGCVGNDEFGQTFLQIFREEGIPTDAVKVSETVRTGCSLVTVETSGQNRICMVPGGNLDYTKEELRLKEDVIRRANVAVTQCEMKPEIVGELARICRESGVKLILNPAPARELSDEILKATYLLTPNETELAHLVGRELRTDDDYTAACRELIAVGVRNVVVTLGARGSLWVNENAVKFTPTFRVTAVDTVGAGDSFTGALAACLDEGLCMERALTVATAVAALSVQKEGAIPSMPTREAVDAFLNGRA